MDGSMAGAVFTVGFLLVITRVFFVASAISSLAGSTPATRPQAANRRTLHRRLLGMHFTAALATSAGFAKYALPVTDTSCRVAHRAMVASILLYDASLVLFLLAKTRVTNGTRVLARWEKCIVWCSRFYAWAYLIRLIWVVGTICLYSCCSWNEKTPVCSVLGRRDSRCRQREGDQDQDDGQRRASVGFVTNNAMLIVQFMLLLAMFLKPLLTSRGSRTQSAAAIYRRVVLRNILCTVGIVFTYTITTICVVLAILSSSNESNKADQFVDFIPSVNIVATLCLTEIALPLGFSSCLKSAKARVNLNIDQGQDQENEDVSMMAALQVDTLQQPARSCVVPLEGP